MVYTQLLLVRRLTMTGDVLLIALYAFMVRTGTTLPIRAGLCIGSGKPG
jgi:hypothetical protein